MERIINVDFETNCKKIYTALNRFFNKFPELNYWEETFIWMFENGKRFFSDGVLEDGLLSNDWAYALHLIEDEDYFYIAVIERE